MLNQLFIISCLALALTSAEAPFGQGRGHGAPYPAAGFRPSQPFPLPNEYLPPTDFETGAHQQYNSNEFGQFEITKQRVDFAGQEVQRFPINEPQSEYGPPRQPGFVNTQGTTDNRRRPFFGQRPDGRRPHAGRPFPGQQPLTPTTQTPQVNFIPQSLPNPTTDERFEPQQTYPQQNDQQHKPASQYGAPLDLDPRSNPINVSEDDDDEAQKQFALDALNAAVDNYNRLQQNNADKISQGQYFVVNPDNSIQKVEFITRQQSQQVKEDSDNNFTAELKYTKVGQLRDPLYKYNSDGQLVRIVKK